MLFNLVRGENSQCSKDARNQFLSTQDKVHKVYRMYKNETKTIVKQEQLLV